MSLNNGVGTSCLCLRIKNSDVDICAQEIEENNKNQDIGEQNKYTCVSWEEHLSLFEAWGQDKFRTRQETIPCPSFTHHLYPADREMVCHSLDSTGDWHTADLVCP